MSKEIYISSTPHETRLAIVESDELTEIYYERENEYTLAGSIYNGRVTRVLPGMQSSFVEIGLERDAFLYITDFMEEAADTAEFDHSGDVARPARVENGRVENGRGEGRSSGGRDSGRESSEGYVSERNREQMSATPASDAARAGEGRGEDSSARRNDRGGRGRGRRDRGGNGDRGRDSGSRFGQSTELNEAGPEIEEVLPVEAIEPMASPEVELGEGAPGADGSRRWRGRRGRRRGRGTGSREGVAEAGTVEGGGEFEEASSFEIDGSVTEEQVAIEPALPEPAAMKSDAPREGQRGRDGRRGERGQQTPRVPRGFAPRRSLYGVDSEPVAEETEVVEAMAAAGSEPEPMILPGESLSKYRQGGEEVRAEAARVSITPVADSGFKVDAGWDGGAMLPGETLSRYRGGASQGPSGTDGRTDGRTTQSGRQDGRRDGRQDSRRDGRSRDGRPGRPERGERTMMVPSYVPAADLQSGGPVAGYAHVAEQVEEIQAHRPEFAEVELPQATAESAQMEDKGLAHQEGNAHHGSIEAIDAAQVSEEYEPEGESASYRVDPSAPSEYRQQGSLAAVEEEELVEEEVAAEGAAGVEPYKTVAHTAVLSALPAGLTAFAAPESRVDERVEVSHDVTTLDAGGGMHSDAVHAPGLEEMDAPTGFAPGAGDLEEDFIEEEELEIASLQAHGDEEFDDLEEEHLDGEADLGMMIRDMSVDEITRTDRSAGEDEEDFEEESLDGESSEESPEVSEHFAAPQDGGFSEDDTPRMIPSRSPDSSNGGSERRGRSESGRRGGRERSGNRESGNRMGRGDRNGGSEERGSGPDRSGLGERARNTGGSGDRDRGRSSGRGGRQTAQMTNLPAISDLLKPGQEILVQIAKEPIAKKGARITSHIALPGRFLVFMPTVSHTGVSRKIESDNERRRLKEILLSEKGEASGGFIVRTAAAGASEEELRSDLRFLLNLWSDIKQRSESSKSPALIYHDLNLVERILRDQVTDNFSAIWVDTETEYERVLRFLQRFQPALIRRVKLYTKETPLFEQFGITEEINKALRSKVWLKSGGSIVINQTEALVAIDINTGKYVGKTARLEDTIVKTNLDAIPEIVRQIRLRDLGGIIIIDFIDMDERKNRNRVMQALEDELKNDRAPSKVLPFNDFGLVAITRKRVKQSLERTLSTTCATCVGTGMVKSPVTVCNDIYVEMRKMHKNLDRGDVMLRVHPEVVKQLKSTGTRWLQEMEEMCGKTILIKSDPSLHPEQFDIH